MYLPDILMKTLQKIIFLLFSGVILAQSQNYAIEVTNNLYATDFDNNEYLYKTKPVSIKKTKKTNQLVAELYNSKNINDLFKETKIDTSAILNNPKSLIKFYNDKHIGWNKQQVDFISEKLNNIETYKSYFTDYIKLGCCVNLHQRYRDEYSIKIYLNGELKDIFTSRKSIIGSKKMPWTNNQNQFNYNSNIDKLIFEIIDDEYQYQKLLNGYNLTELLVTRIIDYNKQTLYELSAYDYIEKLKELKPEFEILKLGEVYGRGRYIWNSPKTYYARLSNSTMLPNVNIMFLASKQGKSIYSANKIKEDYKDIVKRVQKINFLIDHTKQNPSVKLDIYYFDNKPINDYNIDNVNKNQEQWIKYDKFLESIKKYANEDPKPTYANEDAIEVSKQVYCGCNYRFEKEFLEKAIFIELNNSETKDNSVWYLLSNNTVLLHIMQGEKVLNYNYTEFGKYKGIQYPCVLFDLKGNIIDKK